MTKKLTKVTSALFIAMLLSFNGCTDDNDEKTTQTAQNKSMSIDFKAMFGHDELMCSQEGNTTKAKMYQSHHSDAQITIKDFRLFVSDIYLIDEEGNKEMLQLTNNDFQYQDENGSVVLLDFEDNTGNCIDRKNTPATNMIAVGDIKDKNYSKIEFTLGVPFHTNHTENPNFKALNQPGMLWNWQAGRKFTKLESTNDINTSYIFNLHLGSTGCADSDADGVTDSCIQPNKVTITMDFDVSRDEIIINYAKVLGMVDVKVNQGSAPGCMSALNDPECAIILPNLGLDFDAKNGECANEGCEGQQLFSVNTKELF